MFAIALAAVAAAPLLPQIDRKDGFSNRMSLGPNKNVLQSVFKGQNMLCGQCNKRSTIVFDESRIAMTKNCP